MINISVGKGIVLALVIIGLVLGLALGSSELVNPFSSLSEYQRAQVETQQVTRQNEALQDARAQAEAQKLQDEIQYLQQAHEQELERLQLAYEQERQQDQEQAALEQQLFQLAGQTFVVVLGLCLLSFSVGGSVYVARMRPARIDVWTPKRKRQAIKAARQHEREMRQRKIESQERLSELFGTPIGSNGRKAQKSSFSAPSSPLQFYD